jgi:hypothetical protein
MLFQVVHTHTNESCPGQSSEKARQFGEWWQNMKKAVGVKVLSGYVAPINHTFYILVEADDYAALARALGPLNSFGSGHTSPVISLEQTLPMVEAGAFRASK